MNAVSPTSIPRVIARDLTKLPLGAVEGFVLSRIDGATTVADIASVTGQPLADAMAILAKLADLAAIELPGYAPKTSSSPPARPAPEPSTPNARPNGPAPASPPAAAVAIDVSSIGDDHPDLREASDLDLELRKQILALHANLESRDYYSLLGVPRTADRKQIKSAYYGLAARFHTDRHFGKNLGSFKAKLEQIFGQLTVANDTLTAAMRREEYDQYLATQEQTLAYERLLEGYDVDAEPAEERPLREEAVHRSSSDSRFPAAANPSPPAGQPAASPVPPPRASSSSSTMAAANPAEQERIRREALARRLAGSSRRMPATAQPATSAPPGATSTALRVAAPASTLPTAGAAAKSPSAAPQQRSITPPTRPPGARPSPTPQPVRKLSGLMRKPTDDRMLEARRAHVQKLVDAARESAAKGDHLAAANGYRLALQHVDDPALEAAAAEASQKAKEGMVDVYLKQARFEESDKKWGMAALSYLKALAGRPDDPDLCDRAANALRHEGRDLHRAARLAETAVSKNQKKALYRATLGHIYLDAGLFLRARTELENAARLAPNDTNVRELLARARKAAS